MFRPIRKLWVDCNKSMRSLALTTNQAELVILIERRGSMTARLLADIELCSIQSATTKLKVLKDKGYLKRRSTVHSSGGLEYVYEVDL